MFSVVVKSPVPRIEDYNGRNNPFGPTPEPIRRDYYELVDARTVAWAELRSNPPYTTVTMYNADGWPVNWDTGEEMPQARERDGAYHLHKQWPTLTSPTPLDRLPASH